jgi:hypothetical protein
MKICANIVKERIGSMKELEALEWLKNNKTWLNTNKVPEAVYETLLKALTPPTADEVCKALSEEYFNAKVVYSWGEMSFKFDVDWIEIAKLSIQKRVYVTMLPPHLITLIGRFYEGLEK